MVSDYERVGDNCETEVFANAGHYAIEETPVALATAIEKFLARA